MSRITKEGAAYLKAKREDPIWQLIEAARGYEGWMQDEYGGRMAQENAERFWEKVLELEKSVRLLTSLPPLVEPRRIFTSEEGQRDE